jgi:hypothetical protein
MSVELFLLRFEFSMSNAPCEAMMVHISSIPHEDFHVITRLQFVLREEYHEWEVISTVLSGQTVVKSSLSFLGSD